MQARVGGTFAPPLTDESIASYENMATTAPDQVRDAMKTLLVPIKRWWDLPESTKTGTRHASGTGIMVPLEDAHISLLFDDIPWRDELEVYRNRFELLPKGDLRNACFHLLWFVNELYIDREPMTTDKLK